MSFETMTFEPYLIKLDGVWYYIPCGPLTKELAGAKGFEVKDVPD